MRGRILLVGWFSLAEMGATAGDLAACRTVAGWLERAGRGYDVALGPPFEGGVDWRAVDTTIYSHVVHVCGPVSDSLAVATILERFPASRLVAVDVSVVGVAERFHDLIARDGDGDPRPDLTFAASLEPVPVIGVIRAHPQLEYAGGRHGEVDAAIDRLLARSRGAALPIDTRLDVNLGGLRTPEEVQALIARTDVVVTSRLHGLVFSLRNGVPALAIDPIAGGAKLLAQARAVGWDQALSADELDDERLDSMLESCLSEPARAAARECAARGATAVEAVQAELMDALGRRANGVPGGRTGRRLAGLLRRGGRSARPRG